MVVSFRGGADFWLTLLVSALLAQLIALVGYDVFYSDSHTYTHYAVVLSKSEFDPNLGWRTMGYPALLLMTGFTATGSLAGILALQAVTGAAMPLIARSAVLPLDTMTASLVGGTLLLSLIPYFFINTIYPDQLYIFALLLTTALLIRWLLGGSATWLAGAFLSCLVLTYLRPVGLMIIAGLIALPIIQRRDRRRAAAYAGLFFVLLIGPPLIERHGARETPSFLGAQVFYNAYLWSDGDGFSARSSQQEVKSRIRAFFASNPARIKVTELGPPMTDHAYQDLFGRFEGRPDALVDAIFRKPHLHYYWVVASVMNTRPDGGRILLSAALLHYLDHPSQIIRSTFWTYVGLAIGPAWRFKLNDYARNAHGAETIYFEPFEWLGAPDAANSFVTDLSGFAHKEQGALIRKLQSYFSSLYPLLVPASYLLMIIGLFAAGRPGPARPIILTIFGVHTINVLALAVLVDPQFRYQIQSLPLAIMGAGVGIYWLRISTAANLLRYSDKL